MKLFFNLSPRKKEVLLTVSSNLALQVATALTGFVLPPLVIETFGSSVNGMVSSVSQFIAYLNIVEAGVGGAAIAALYRPLALGDSAARNAILSAAAKFYRRSGVLFTILIFALAFVYPLIVGSEVDRIQSALMVLVLGITGAAEFFLIGKYRVLLTADKKVYVISLVQMIALILSTALAVALIKAGLGIVAVKLASSLVFLFRYFVLSIFVRRRYPNVDFRAESDANAINQSRNVLVHQIGALVVFNSPLVIITIFCSLKDASVYTVYAMVFNAIGNFLDAFGNGIASFFGESLVKDSLDRTRNIFGKYETIYFAVQSWFYGLAYILIIPFMQLYTAKMTDAEYVLPVIAILFLAESILRSLRKPGEQMIIAAGHYKQTQKLVIAEAGIRFSCSLVFTIAFGMKGVLLGGLVSHLYRAVAHIIYATVHILKKSPLMSFAKIFLFSILTVFLLFIVQLKEIQITSYSSWILYACVIGTILAFPFVGIVLLSVKLIKKEAYFD